MVEEKLEEKNFIQEGEMKNPLPIWLWILIVVALLAIFSSGGNWLLQQVRGGVGRSSFLQVTNRQMSLFLWQHPSLMRTNVRSKMGYLPGFPAKDDVAPHLDTIDDYVIAPPEVLFLFHTWKRLLGNYTFPREITTLEFKEFLEYNKEWQLKYWKEAPEDYRHIVQELDTVQELYLVQLPRQVQLAFVGWKNYFKEGKEIETLKLKGEDLKPFLESYPHYERNYWVNIYPEYLKSVDNTEKILPEQEIPAFLRIAFFNFTQQ